MGVGLGSNQFVLSQPRVKSPPPAAGAKRSAIYSPRRTDQVASTPSIHIEHSNPLIDTHDRVADTEEDSRYSSGMRTPARGLSGNGPTLETVQESSLPATPAIGTSGTQEGKGTASNDRPEIIAENPLEEALSKEPRAKPESGSESGGNKSASTTTADKKDPRRIAAASNSAKPQIVHPKKSSTQLHPAKGKTAAEGSVKNMTVETETVSTIPHVALGGGTGERAIFGRAETGGSLRLKPSNETIKPKKEKKRITRKPPSINSGTGGSLSRRFHHHHIHTRPPSAESTVSLSIVTPVFSPSYVHDRDYSQHALPSSTNEHPHVPKRNMEACPSDPESTSTPSSAVLTTFRVRTASSKADIFEAKVASAVDEVDSSDSEETFVYESNPPEPLSARPHRFHSRTPSATSTVSQMDQYGTKVRVDGHHSIAGKRSMKFTNTHSHLGGYPGDSADGTVRGPSNTGRVSGSNVSHHHIGRHGRSGPGHPSLFDTDSLFSNSGKPSRSATSSLARFSPRTSGPRSPYLSKALGNTNKPNDLRTYDLEGEGADDEQTPLVGSVRSSRSRYNRRPGANGAVRAYSTEEKRQPFCRRVTAFVSLGTLFVLLITAIIIILLMCSEPLYDVYVKDIRNVLASEQEIMLDLQVHAVNPNLIAVQVSDLDVNIFAKSKHVGTSACWREHKDRKSRKPLTGFLPLPIKGAGLSPLSDEFHDRSYTEGGVDKGTDPIDDPAADSQTMLLGRIFEFDSPLIFEPSPIKHYPFSAMGELRLAQPGNKTEEGGTERWESVIQHDFELIVRGVLRYSTPITSRLRSASISKSILVHPGADEGRMDLVVPAPPHRDYWMLGKDDEYGRRKVRHVA